MNKIIITLVTILIILIAIIAGVWMFNNAKVADNTDTNNLLSNNINLSEKVTDECVEEWEEMQNDLNTIDTTANDVKLSPNCSFTFQKHYLVCDHTAIEYTNIPQEAVNKTEEELQQEYSDWKVEKFTENEVILSKDFEGECGEHYVLKNVDGNIVVFKIVNGIEEEYEKTDISVDYMTETDKISFENGLKVYGKQNLSQILEDFE